MAERKRELPPPERLFGASRLRTRWRTSAIPKPMPSLSTSKLLASTRPRTTDLCPLSAVLRPLAQQLLERGVGFGAELRCFGVVALGQFFRWRRGGSVNHGQIKMRIGVVRFDRECFEHFLFCRFLPAFLAGGNPQIVVGRSALRINGE